MTPIDRPLPATSPRTARVLAPRLIAGAIVVALAAVFLIPRWFPAGPGGQLVALGTLEATEVTVSSEVSARIVAIAVDEGQTVHAGDVLVRLDDAAPQLQYRQAGTVEQENIALVLAKYQLRAPRDGVVLRRDVEPGEVAGAGATLLTIGTLGTLDLTVYVPQRDLGRIHLGQRASVVAEALPDVAFDGVVQRISDQAEFTPRNAQTTNDRLNLVFGVKVRVRNVDNRIKPGMTANAWFVE